MQHQPNNTLIPQVALTKFGILDFWQKYTPPIQKQRKTTPKVTYQVIEVIKTASPLTPPHSM